MHCPPLHDAPVRTYSRTHGRFSLCSRRGRHPVSRPIYPDAEDRQPCTLCCDSEVLWKSSEKGGSSEMSRIPSLSKGIRMHNGRLFSLQLLAAKWDCQNSQPHRRRPMPQRSGSGCRRGGVWAQEQVMSIGIVLPLQFDRFISLISVFLPRNATYLGYLAYLSEGSSQFAILRLRHNA
jgi:hypothetical protein